MQADETSEVMYEKIYPREYGKKNLEVQDLTFLPKKRITEEILLSMWYALLPDRNCTMP